MLNKKAYESLMGKFSDQQIDTLVTLDHGDDERLQMIRALAREVKRLRDHAQGWDDAADARHAEQMGWMDDQNSMRFGN